MIECWSEKARNGSPVLYEKQEETVWRLNSLYSPEKEAERWAEQYEIKDIETPVCVFGLGSGYFLKALLERAKEDTLFLVVEPDKDVYEYIKKEFPIEALEKDDRVCLVIGQNTEVIAYWFYQYVDWKNINSSIYCVHPYYNEIYQEEYRAYLKTIRDCQMKEDTLSFTTEYHGTRRAENMLKALQLLPENTVLKKLPESLAEQVPFILIAAGPSLESNVEELKKAAGKAVLLAVDRAFPILQKHGVRPDLVITLDPIKSPKHIEGLEGIPLLCTFASNKKTMEQHPGSLIFYGGHGYAGELLKRINKVVPGVDRGGSVATAAFTVCRALKIKNTILVGQDLAYKDGQVYASGGQSKKRIKKYKVEGINGEQIETRNDWYIFLRWFEEEIKENPWMHVIDATEGGAKIQGTELEKLSDVLERLPDMPVPVEKVLEEMQDRISIEEYQTMLEKPKEDLAHLKEIEKQAKEAGELLEQLLRACRNKSIDDPKYGKLVKKLGKLNEEIEQHSILSFLEYYAGGESQKELNGIYQMGEDTIENKEKVYQQAKRFYEMYQRNSEKLAEEMQLLFSQEEKQ